jgi:squalene synthase HpnC
MAAEDSQQATGAQQATGGPQTQGAHSPTPVNEQQLRAAYHYCRQLVHSHYENFPVASFILPRQLRRPISVIYAFARTADDFADEGDWDAETRLTKLKDYDDKLEAIAAGEAVDDPIFIALQHVLQQHQLPVQLFHDLITAFRLDVSKQRYASMDEVWDYCRYSANPVGRLLLHLLKADTAQNLERSDAICSALQLINFLQDISQDLSENNRIYLPQDELEHFDISEEQLRSAHSNKAMRCLLRQQIRYAREKMLFGQPLGRAVKGRFGFQLRLMINGGLRVLDLLERQQQDLFSRPRLKTRDWLWMLWKAI